MSFKAYLRVSTDMQAESGLGIESQRISCIEYAKKLGHEVTEFYVDAGYSGSLSIAKRPGLLKAMCELEEGDVLIVAKRDRIGRDVLLMCMLEKELKKKKAKIISVSGEGTQDDDPSSFLIRKVTDIISEYERRITQERVKSAMAVKKSRNERVGYIPYGFQLSSDGVILIQNPEELTIIDQIFSLKRSGLTYRGIASQLTSIGIYTRNHTPWNHVSIFNLVKKLGKHG